MPIAEDAWCGADFMLPKSKAASFTTESCFIHCEQRGANTFSVKVSKDKDSNPSCVCYTNNIHNCAAKYKKDHQLHIITHVSLKVWILLFRFYEGYIYKTLNALYESV